MKIAIIGCGNMGSGFAERLAQNNQLFLYDHHSEKTDKLEKKGYGKACHDIKEALQSSEIVILAIKPQNLAKAANAISESLLASHFLISLLAGTSLEVLKQYFPSALIIRMMPNLPLIYGQGVIGLCSDEKIAKSDQETLTKYFAVLGKTYWLSEEKIDALGALAGSGPAFFFVIVESMIDAGIAMGFTFQESKEIVYQTLQGSLTLLERTEKTPCELKWQITSPKGTTVAGLQKLEESALRGGIIDTFLATYDRTKQL